MKRHQWNRRTTVGSAGSGFTLVELLVVILILSALLLIALPKYFHAVYASRVQGCKAQITIINTAAQVFFAKNKVYPAPAWVKSPPLDEVPLCPFGTPYTLIPILQDGTTGASPTPGNPQVGVAVDALEHFVDPWKTMPRHRE
jgi:prepilin-type N-terminal cleavage/methylation domain-containing protein